MPLYEYECQNCHRHLEKIQKFSDAPLTECPHCGGLLQKVITAPAVQFKGGGWYADLYSSSKKSSGDKTASSSGSSESVTPAAASAPASTPSAPAAPSSSPAPKS